MTQPAVLLLSPGILRWEDVDFGVPHLVSIGGYLQHHLDVRVEILDLNYEGGDLRDLERRLDALGPFLLIGVSAYSSFDLLRVLSLARFLRERFPGVPLVTGGYHASALPQDLLGAFDRVVPGEGEREMLELVQTVLGGQTLEPGVSPPQVVPELDALPPYRWELLDRYWPHATRIGRKFQIYLSRGCPYRCAFCMERAKSGYSWRAYSPERALDELARLSRFTDLSAWTINLADPLFGFRRRWRREVLAGIAKRGLLPKGYWTLTRSDDLDDDDIRLLAEARFAIGIGLESGSPAMLRIMQKGNQAERYLDAVRRLARLSQRHGLNWATNVIVGHPGETPDTAAETLAFVRELFLSGPSSHGWLSVDPFRLYPGSQVHEQQDHYAQRYGTRFYHPTWWHSWYDGPWRAQHLDPSRELDYAARVRWMFDQYGPLVRDIHARFQPANAPMGDIYARSQLAEVDQLSPAVRDIMLRRVEHCQAAPQVAPVAAVPLGLDVRDPALRSLEEAVRARLDRGLVVADALLSALFAAPPHGFLPEADAAGMLADQPPPPHAEGAPALTVSLGTLIAGLQAAAPAPGERVVDLGAESGHVAALLAELVGPRGEVVAVARSASRADALRERLRGYPQITVVVREPSRRFELPGRFDVAWWGAALPLVPATLPRVLSATGRAITAVGPRFRDQDLVLVTADGAERRLGRVRWPVLGGADGWVPLPVSAGADALRFARWPAPALLFEVLAACDLGHDVAAVPAGTRSQEDWAVAVAQAWPRSAGRLAVHALGLMHEDVDALLAALHTPPAELDDDAGKALCAAVARGLQARRTSFEAAFTPTGPPDDGRAALGEELQRLRAALWAPQGRRPPPLVVLDVPALGRAARATAHAGVRRVATSLAEPPAHVLMQVLHEEMHPITDPVVLASLPGAVRDTRPGEPGFEVHQKLEETVLAATAAFLQARAPEHMASFEDWLTPFTGAPPMISTFLLFALGCSGSSDNDDPTDAGTDVTADTAETELPAAGGDWCAVQSIFAQHCLSCHGTASQLGDLDLQADPHGALVGVTSAATGAVLVQPGDPDGSLLVRKMNNTQAANEGGVMPLSGVLDPKSRAEVQQWVLEGAGDVCDKTLPTGETQVHPDGYVEAAVHGLDAKLQVEDCTVCHGTDFDGGKVGVSCTTCHDKTVQDWTTECTFCPRGPHHRGGGAPRRHR